MQPSTVLGFKACLPARKVVHCTEVCKGSGMLWYGYAFGLLGLRGVKIELVQPFL